MKVFVDHFASVTHRLGLANPVEIDAMVSAEPGTVVVVEVLQVNPQYGELERTDAVKMRLQPGDLVAGALGSRQALRGFSGYSPVRLAPMDMLHLLNMGGVIGRAYGPHAQLGMPTEVRLVGGTGKRLADSALAARNGLPKVPIVLVAGSCMNVGKTTVAMELVKRLRKAGHAVGAAKVTGVAALRDLKSFESAGATRALSFIDCGIASTVDAPNLTPVVHTLIGHLADGGAQVAVVEIGDGLFGYYNVEGAMADKELRERTAAVVYCASDLAAAWAGIEWLKARGWPLTIVSGPVTDSEAGMAFLKSQWQLAAANVYRDGEALGRAVIEGVEAWRKRSS